MKKGPAIGKPLGYLMCEGVYLPAEALTPP